MPGIEQVSFIHALPDGSHVRLYSFTGGAYIGEAFSGLGLTRTG